MSFIRQLNYALILVCLLLSCKTQKKKIIQGDSSRYDLLNPVIIKLPEALAEISGIVYNPSDTSVFAIEDEDGLFYKIYLTKQTAVKKWRFDKKHDFEDVVLHDSIFYVLISNGDVESVRFGGNDSIITNMSKFPDASKKTNEFESMYYDDSLRQLILLCKSCEDDNSKTLTAWSYDIATQTYTPSVFIIDVRPIEAKTGIKKLKLRPSAAAINPLTNELYILSSINHLIIVADRKGVFKELFELDPKIYKQAEGIAFTPSGEMIISNESHETGVANILIIKNKKKVL
ncbi:SdiA-regulated domain-containing protein [Ferruginibacter lapsinanis]|uniref:SdiA-regulated domain-containing protein n=1 Tax=Ferruginibacter lapsinanis TaxID=563172 RepID=UPI001E3355CB|nr:SdiA-regulated domain-containing protein [Ferruginibacter lapsinanis]UEG49099.1 SdiA-regulated domain-containing protein [Ferruginibacter lapsinanis]